MGTITVLDPHAEEIKIVLLRLLAECEAGELMGAIIVTEKHDGYDLDMPGTFSTEPDCIAAITGRLQIAAHTFYNMAWNDEY
tara:strand:+ start:885 stop:1130 length:246 start_codon:yes stop_codon:yes gene_type:complete